MDDKYELNPFILAPCAISSKFLTRTQLCEGSTFIEFPNGMKLFHPLRNLKSLDPNQIHFLSMNYVSTGAILGLCQNFQFVKQVYFIVLHFGWNFFQTFSYPYDPSPQGFGSSQLAMCLEEFSEFSRQRRCLWNKYHFGKTIWNELFIASLYVQIIKLCQFLAQSNTPSECLFII